MSHTLKKKVSRFSRPQPGCHWPNYPWAGIIKLIPGQGEFDKWHPGWGRENCNLFFSALICKTKWSEPAITSYIGMLEVICMTTSIDTVAYRYTVIRFLLVSAKFGTCTVVSVNGTLVEAKMCTFTLEYTHFIFNKCPIYTHDGASAKFSTTSQETDLQCKA